MKTINSIANSYEKELRNPNPKELKNKGIDNLLVDTGLSIMGKKIKRVSSKFKSSGITLGNN